MNFRGSGRCCQGPGDICLADDQCCPHGDLPTRCIDGHCCTPPGASCAGNAECCFGECENGVCQTPLGAACARYSDCSGWKSGGVTCAGKHVIENGESVFRGHCAVFPGGTCSSDTSCAGDECRDGRCCLHSPSELRTCTRDAQCCDGVCLRDSCCQPMGAACDGVNQCCNGRTCAGGRCCTSLHNGCTAGPDCCGDLICGGGACCRGVGHSCGGGLDFCCTGLGCDRELGHCVDCLAAGKTCSFSSECCGDLVCDRDVGCVTCLAEGARCLPFPYSLPNECCEGLTCGGTNNTCVRTDQ
jgi:hypothetical protein